VVYDFNNRIRVGYNISKKIGKSTTRNKIKRRVKEVIRSLSKKNSSSLDILFIAKKPICNLGFIEISDQINKYLIDYLI